MMVTKCDLCKKLIKGDKITAGIGFLERFELCEKCGTPVKRFLKKHKLIGDKNKKK